MRKLSVLGVITAASFATATMGQPLTEGGKFSVSNFLPIIFCLVGVPLFLAREKRVDRRVVWFLLCFNAAACLSFAIFAIRFRWEPNFLVLGFQNVALVASFLLIWYGSRNDEEFRRAVKLGIYLSLPIVAYYGWQDFSAKNFQWMRFGMDDKTHSAVIFCCEAYILVRFFGRKLDYLLAAGLATLALVTISREIAFLFPPILLALSARSRYGVALSAAILGGGVTTLVVAPYATQTTFSVFARLSSIDQITGEGSTQVHMMLLKSAVYMKFSDPLCFLFGIGPGNFSKALSTFQILLPDMKALDPTLAANAMIGATPAHSVPVSLLLDMNIALVLLGIYLLVKAFAYLLRPGNLVDAAFALCLFMASMFYSMHDKPYLFLMVSTLIVLIRNRNLAAERNLGRDTGWVAEYRPLAG